jgi:cytochrome c
MKKIAAAILAASTLVVASAAVADELEDMMKKNGCNACHAEDKKVIGPSYKDVAAKYKGDATAPAKLAEKVKKGGSGVWGPVPMPPNAQVKDDDVKKMVQLILALKK